MILNGNCFEDTYIKFRETELVVHNWFACGFTAHCALRNAERNLKSTSTNGFNFRIINSLMESWGHMIEHELDDWLSKTWTGLIKHGLIKHGLNKRCINKTRINKTWIDKTWIYDQIRKGVFPRFYMNWIWQTWLWYGCSSSSCFSSRNISLSEMKLNEASYILSFSYFLSKGSFHFVNNKSISYIILLHEKFRQFDLLRAVVFQLNLKYLHVKITNLLRVVV